MYKKIDVTFYDNNIDEIITVARNIWIDEVTNYENKKGKTLKRQSRKNQIKFLTSLIHSKYYQSRANNKNGLLPSQWDTAFKSFIKMPIWKQAHIVREQQKRT